MWGQPTLPSLLLVAVLVASLNPSLTSLLNHTLSHPLPSHPSANPIPPAVSESGEQPTRLDILKAAFGPDAAQGFEDNLDDFAKAHFEAYKFKIQQQKPVNAKRAELAKKVPSFWVTSIQNCRNIANYVDAVDEDAFKHLTGVDLVHDEKDVRNFEVKFTFAAKNPYFKETTLSKSFTITPPSSLTPAPEPVTSHDLEAPLYLVGSTPISWTSPDHDLTKKAPRGAAPTDKEEYDGLEGPGSFFNLFTEEGEDTMDVGQTFLEWWGHATEYAAGLASLDDLDSDDGGDFSFGEFGDEDSEDESEDDDPKKEVDLEDERPKKKQRSKK